MLNLRPISLAVILAGAILSREVTAQGASVSLTHTVTVTVPPRLKVQIGTSTARTVEVADKPSANGLSLSIKATQPWSLFIGASKSSRLQWSRDPSSGFASIAGGESAIASGRSSPVVTSAMVFVRSAAVSSESSEDKTEPSAPVLLTIVAQ
jgi:hypothetical protein